MWRLHKSRGFQTTNRIWWIQVPEVQVAWQMLYLREAKKGKSMWGSTNEGRLQRNIWFRCCRDEVRNGPQAPFCRLRPLHCLGCRLWRRLINHLGWRWRGLCQCCLNKFRWLGQALKGDRSRNKESWTRCRLRFVKSRCLARQYMRYRGQACLLLWHC